MVGTAVVLSQPISSFMGIDSFAGVNGVLAASHSGRKS
jgi:hypothetical protein